MTSRCADSTHSRTERGAVKISVVFSFFNEEDVLEELVTRVRNAFRNDLKGRIDSLEMIFVNDRSTDGSVPLLHRLAEGNDDIRIITMSRNFGVSPCVFAGFEHASGDAVIYMDADLQDPPELIPQMADLWLNTPGLDVIHTRRESRGGESRLKLLITRIGYAILQKVSHITIQPEVGDFKLLSRRAVNQLIRFKEHRPFTRGLVNWIGFNQTTITYHREERFAGETKFPIISWGVISNFLDSALISFSDAPLKISLLLGFLVSFGAFCYLIMIFVMKYLNWSLPGWSAIMATMLLLGGIQLFTMGMLGLYINSIFIESKKRPNYIVESTFGFDSPLPDQKGRP